MTSPFWIIAKVESRPENVAVVKRELCKLIPFTLKETGCLQYDLHQDNNNPEIFIFMSTGQAVSYGKHI